MSRAIGVVFVTRNPDLDPLFAAVAECAKVSSRIVVVDNGSSLETQAELATLREIHGVFLIAHQNVGIAAAQNEAIQHLAQESINYVLFFDQDTEIDIATIRQLFEVMEGLLADGIDVAAVGPTLGQAKATPGLQEEPFLASSGSLVPLSTLRVVGMFREEYFIDHVDKEWGLRAGQKGYRSFRLRNAVVPHEFAEQGREWRGRKRRFHYAPERSYYLVRNEILRWTDLELQGGERLRYGWILLKWSFMSLVAGERRIERSIAMLRGLADGLRGVAGKIGEPVSAHRQAPVILAQGGLS